MLRKKITTKKVLVNSQLPAKVLPFRKSRISKRLSDQDIKLRIKRIDKDFRAAFKLLRNNTDTVTFFGSARYKEGNQYYEQARTLAHRISRELGLTIVTGGGPGIMEAANRGAQEACLVESPYHVGDGDAALYCGDSLSMTIELPMEQTVNPYVSASSGFYYFFSRKMALTYSARSFICLPGGFGTLDEFFEVLTLKQTGKIPDIPIILVGTKFWKPLLNYIDKSIYQHAEGIDKEDMNLYVLTDDFDEIVKIVKNGKSATYKPATRRNKH